MTAYETGGLKINRNNGIGKVADVSWEGRGHTYTNVNLLCVLLEDGHTVAGKRN